jgi:hypothetical protein
MNHFTDLKGFNAIRATPIWRFRAKQPRGRRPFGAYFTPLSGRTPDLARHLRLPKDKLEYVFSFTDRGDLIPLRGGRGIYVFYCPTDYEVEPDRQTYQGKRVGP